MGAKTHLQLEWVRPPQQARSQQTLERLLDAAEAIIGAEGIDNATVAQIAQRAGSSVGAFYTRFADKEALLRCVLERFHEQALATAEAVLEPTRWLGMPARDALEHMMLFMLRILQERRGIIQALTVRAAADPQMSALAQRLSDHIVRHMRALIAHNAYAVSHPDPDTAVQVAVWLVLSAMEARVLYGSDHPARLSDQTVAAEIADMVVRYVGIDETNAAATSAPRAVGTQ